MSDSTAISQETVSGPSGPEPLILPLAQVLPYDLNPRQSVNQEFERIKASIREVGLDQPLTVTRRPGASDYMVHSGGNTRLQALKALHTETGDDRFSSVPCLYKPWIRESAVLLAHLRENDLRGGLSYIEKSQAVLQLKTLLEQEQGQALSQRELETALSQGGFALASGQLTRMSYAVHILLPLIPQALYAGMGRPQVQRIRALQRAALCLWQEWELGEEVAFDAIFAELCRRYDSPEWEMELLRGALENELAEQAETSVHLIRVALEGELQGYQVYIPPEPEPDQSSSGNDGSEITYRSKQTGLLAMGLSQPEEERDSWEARNTPVSTQKDQPAFNRPVPDFPETDRDISTALYQLRQRAFDQATRLAQRHGLGDLVAPLSELGLGFTLRDLPDASLGEQLDDATLDQLALIWWHLAACAELTVGPAQALVPHLAPGSLLCTALVQRDLTPLFQQVRCFDPSQSGYRLWRHLGEADWADFLGLMESYRQLHHLAEAKGLSLWETT